MKIPHTPRTLFLAQEKESRYKKERMGDGGGVGDLKRDKQLTLKGEEVEKDKLVVFVGIAK